jgi:hypothetical protein
MGDGVERLDGLMKGLKLSAAEMRGVKVGRVGSAGRQEKLDQAIGKLLADKQALPEALEHALGPIWCPMKGIECKGLGENVFLFTFLQIGGRKKAVEGGPWMFEKNLLVLEEFDPCKNVDDYKFEDIPIWVRVFKLPLGMMSRASAEDIGGRIGEFLAVEGVENGLAMGQFLKIQVRMKINEPLMRGTMVEVDDGGRMIWCPFVYEYLPDFCYICGRIGHIDRDCSVRLPRGEDPQFGAWLKWVPPKRLRGGDGRRWLDGNGRRGVSSGFGGSGSRSDAPSWRKDALMSGNSQKREGVGEKEGKSPLKITMQEKESSEGGVVAGLGGKVALQPGVTTELEERNRVDPKEKLEAKRDALNEKGGEQKGGLVLNEVPMVEQREGMLIDGDREKVGADVPVGGGMVRVELLKHKTEGAPLLEVTKENKGGMKKFKKVLRTCGSGSAGKTSPLPRKRGGDEMEIDEDSKGKKKRVDVHASGEEKEEVLNIAAGLSEQPCRSQ